MPTTRQLRDLYRFPGFEPLASVHGIFGEPMAVVVTLQRRRKKRRVEFVGKRRLPFTINGHAVSVTFPVATSASMLNSPFVGCSADGAVR